MGSKMRVIHFDKAESYEPEIDWKRVSLLLDLSLIMK